MRSGNFEALFPAMFRAAGFQKLVVSKGIWSWAAPLPKFVRRFGGIRENQKKR